VLFNSFWEVEIKMKIEISMLDGQQLKANFGEHQIISDQSLAAGGKAAYPEPIDYFLASMPLCAAFYIRKFCQSRDISTDGIKISQENSNIDDNDRYKKQLSISVELPESFPKKYHKAVLAAANTCTVKKVIQAMPEFEMTIIAN
jgi:uncharacterized OsmC-like protein